MVESRALQTRRGEFLPNHAQARALLGVLQDVAPAVYDRIDELTAIGSWWEDQPERRD